MLGACGVQLFDAQHQPLNVVSLAHERGQLGYVQPHQRGDQWLKRKRRVGAEPRQRLVGLEQEHGGGAQAAMDDPASPGLDKLVTPFVTQLKHAEGPTNSMRTARR